MSEQSSTTSMTPRLLAFLHGRRSLAELPDALELPTALWQHMSQLWQHSVSKIEQGVVQEWGGLLVLDEQIGLKLVALYEGVASRVLDEVYRP